MKNILFLLGAIFVFANCTDKKVYWHSTTQDEPWVQKEALRSTSVAEGSAIVIDPDSARQVVDGFGACFNELGWEAVQSLPADKQKEILASLFDTVAGCRFNIFRMPLGANDYSVDWYSFNETPEDYEMINFTIERDKQRLVPYIKIAQTFNPLIKIWASPWCPPSWMKTNGHYACKSKPEVNDLPIEKQGQEMVTQFRMEEKVLEAYALYFEKFIKAYQTEGIDISSVHVQNEMNSCQNFPSCIWRPEDLAQFIGKYLGPRFEASGMDVDIWYGTVERPHIERVDTALQHPLARKYIKGVGFQWAGKGAIPEVHKKYPNMKLMQTETECGNGSNDWAAAEHTFSLIKHYFRHGANAYMYWNMVLDETGKSQWGWKQNSMISIDKATGKVTYNPEYYLMKHFSWFVEPGSSYIPVASDENCLAFIKKNKIVVFYYNASDKEETKQFSVSGRTTTATLNAKSFNTLVIEV